MKTVWERFKHRNIAKIATAYAVVGWIMLQVIEIVLPTFNAPQWIAQTIIFVVIMGFPIALLIAWASEIKSGRYEKDIGDGTSGPVIENKKAVEIPKRLFYTVGAVSISVIGLFAFYVSTVLFSVDRQSVNTNLLSSENEQISISQNYRGPRFSINLGSTGFRALHNTSTDVAISDDGRLLAFLDHGAQSSEILVRDLLFPDSVRSIGTVGWVQGSGQMFFSEDGEWLHFIDNGRLKRVRVEGGQYQTLSDTAQPVRSTFVSFEDRLIFGESTDGLPYEQVLSTGEIREIPIGNEESRFYSWPRVLPGFTHLLLTSSDNLTSVGTGNIELLDLENGSLTTIIRAASNAQYVNSGHIIFVRDASIWAVPFDLESLTLSGAQVPVIQGIESNGQYGHATFSVSSAGRLVYLAGTDGGEVGEQNQLRWISKDGGFEDASVPVQSYGHLDLSPSQDQATFTVYTDDGSSDVWVWDINRGTLGRRTFEGQASRSIWSPDGTTLYYRHSESGLKAVAANGTEQPVTVFETNSLVWPQTVSPDGSSIVFTNGQPYSAYRLSLGNESSQTNELAAELLELAPLIPPWLQAEISPDGNFIAYCSNETGANHIYVRPWPEINRGKWQVTIEPACALVWDHSGDSMYFLGPEAMQQISYSIGELDENGKPSLIEFGIPEAISGISTPNIVNSPNAWKAFDYSSERGQFIGIGRVGAFLEGSEEELLSAQTTLTVVENWLEEVASLAPADPNFMN